MNLDHPAIVDHVNQADSSFLDYIEKMGLRVILSTRGTYIQATLSDLHEFWEASDDGPESARGNFSACGGTKEEALNNLIYACSGRRYCTGSKSRFWTCSPAPSGDRGIFPRFTA